MKIDVLLPLRLRAVPTLLRSVLTSAFFSGLLAAMAAGALSGSTLQAQTAHFSGTQTTVVTGLNPYGVAVDSSGNLYIADAGQVLKETLSGGSYTQTTVVSGLNSPQGVAVDSSGNVYIADTFNSRVLKETLSGDSYTQTTVGSGLSNPTGVAVDGSGNVYIVDADQVLKETLSGSSYAQSTVVNGLNEPTGVAVDSSGNVYIADYSTSPVLKETLSGGSYTQTTVGSGLNSPLGVAVDSSGNVYIADYLNSRVLKETLSGGSYTQTTVGSGLVVPISVAVDSRGNLYIGDNGDSRVLKEDYADTPNFGSVNVGSTSVAATLVFTFDTGGNIGSPAVLTQGAAGLDFADAGTGTCTTNGTGHSYNTGDTCTVNVTFTPTMAGTRTGAVVLNNSSGNPIAIGNIYGTGTGPQVAFTPGAASVIGTGSVSLQSPYQIAMDGSGNMYVGNYGNNTVAKIPVGGGSASVVSMGSYALGQITGVAVDAAGNLFISDYYNSLIYEVTPAGAIAKLTITAASNQISLPTALAIDVAGNLYIADYNNGRVVKVTPPAVTASTAESLTGTVVNTGGYSFSADTITGLAVDAAENLYITDRYANKIIKVTPTGAESTVTISDSNITLKNPQGVTVDSIGNLYIVDSGNNRVVEVTTTGVASVVQIPGLTVSDPFGVTVAPNGNIYIPDFSNNRIVEVNVSTPPGLSFANTAVGNTSTDSPQTVTVENIGNAPLTFPLPSTGNDASISTGFTLGNSSTCPQLTTSSSTQGTLAQTSSCTYMVSFAPVTVGSSNGSLVLTDTALNANPSTTQTISLSGTAQPATPTLAFAAIPAHTYGDAPFVVSATSASSGAVTYAVTSGPATVSGNTVTIDGTGTVTLTANQAADGNYTATTANASFLVNPETPTLAFTATPTHTFGDAQFTVSATSASAGTVTYTVVSGPATISGGTVTITGTGSIQLSASQAATSNYTTAMATTNFLVNPETPTLAFSAIPTHTFGDAPFMVSATSASAGTVTYSVTSGPATITGSTLTITGAGSVMLSASQAAASNYVAATASSGFTVSKEAATDAVSASSTTTVPLQSVTLTATVKSVTSGSPSGTVTFYDNGSQLGSPVALANGTAQFLTTALMSGQQHVITVSYSGDANFLGNAATSSPATTVTVTSLDFTLSNATTQSQGVVPGSAAAFGLSLTPTNGTYPGVVSFTATGLPSGATATFSPATIAAGDGAKTVTLTVQTPTLAKLIESKPRHNGFIVVAFLFLPLAGTRQMRRAARRLGRRTSLVLFLLLSLGAVAGLSGCGTGISYLGQPPESYTITVTATSGTVQHSSNVTLQVQ